MDRRKKHIKKAAVEAETAADRASAAIDHAAAAVNQAAAALVAALGQAQEKAAPAAKVALAKSMEIADRTKESAQKDLAPKLAGAAALVTPGVDAARQRVADDLLPKLTEILHEAEDHPAVKEATKRGFATVAALKGDLDVRTPAVAEKKGGAARTLAKVMAAGALLAGAAVAVRQFLLSKDDGWTAHEPSPAYTADTHKADSTLVYSTGGEERTEEVPATQPVEGDAEARMTAEGGPVAGGEDFAAQAPAEGDVPDVEAVQGASAPAGVVYGEGAYVGSEPPADHTIKGNERSKKYHTPDSAGYERTIADVWFVSEEAARTAGFSKAQR
ncbi:hypothetical protein [Aestuariimicrobium sp. p3-SID1156]|uniref:sunset domain-containing protein n=1 Tax=Aestuariimicrobium sp. p3-SID1156 TaxID=2916038 RepID=UPI002883344E|nr:hypothetical protein [Aestuariimicrobium sp. p3-SID1156]